MTSTLVAVALAASTSIFAAPAQADIGFKKGIHSSHHGHQFGNRGFGHRQSALIKKKKAFSGIHANNRFNTRHHRQTRFGYGVNSYGQTAFTVNKLKQEALSYCSVQLRHDAHNFGYRGAQLTGAEVKQVGKDKFVIHGGAKLSDGYKFSHEAYNCTVAHGQVIDAYKPKKLRF